MAATAIPKEWLRHRINPYMLYGGESIETQLEVELCHKAFEEGGLEMYRVLQSSEDKETHNGSNSSMV